MLLGLIVAAAVAVPPALTPPPLASDAQPKEVRPQQPTGALLRRAMVDGRINTIALRGIDTVWEVHADGSPRSCRRIHHFASAEQFHFETCSAINTGFVPAAAAHLDVPPGEILTVRLENEWLVEPSANWRTKEYAGEVLVRAEAIYQLNEDQSVLSCTPGPAAAEFRWRLEPCFRTSFKDQVPPHARSVRFAVRWVVARGSDTERPSTFPMLIRAKSPQVTPAPSRIVPPPPSAPKRKRGWVAAKAKASLASYLTSDDYPAEAIRQEQQGTTAFRLSIDRGGTVTACQITQSSSSSILDEATCRLLQQRARFDPARDRRGRVVEDQVHGRIIWKLPEPDKEYRVMVPERQTITFRILRDDSLADCRGEMVDGGKVVLRREGADCPAVAPPAATMSAIRGQSAVAEPLVRSDRLLLRRASDLWPQFKEPGQKLLSRVDARLTVEADGRVSRCTVLEMTSLIGQAVSPCDATGLLKIDPKNLSLPGELRVTTAILLESEPTAAK